MARIITEKQLENLVPGPSEVETPEDYDGPIEYLNWNGHKIAAFNAVDLNAQLLNQIKARINDNRSVIIIITGSPGTGKSWITLRLAEILDPNVKILDIDDEFYFKEEYDAAQFVKKKEHMGYLCEKIPHDKGGFIVKTILPDENRDPSQVVFDRSHFLHLIGNDSPLKRGQIVLADEAQYAMGSRNWYNDIQKDLMEAVESVRSRGFIILIVALHLNMLDKVIRQFVLTYMFHVEDRGRAVVYRLYTPRFESEMRKKRLGELMLKPPSFDECPNNNCLSCPDLYGNNKERKRCTLYRALYERRKKQFVGAKSKEAEEKALASKKAGVSYTDDQLCKVILEHQDEIVFLKNGRPSPASMKLIVRDYLDGFNLGINRSGAVRNQFEIEHPEIKAPDT